MRLIVAALVSIAMSGCVGVPISAPFPEVPTELDSQCEPLQVIPETNDKLSVLLEVVNGNYKKYAECRIKVESWISWYQKQKQLFNSELSQ